MAKQNGDQTPIEKFTAYNPYAVQAMDSEEGGNLDEALVRATLAVAFELKQLNGAVRFGGRSK
jgi:hypothetical protein